MAAMLRSVVLTLAVLMTVTPAFARRSSCRRACRPVINQCQRQCRRDNKGSPGIARGCRLGCNTTFLNDCAANGVDAACKDAAN